MKQKLVSASSAFTLQTTKIEHTMPERFFHSLADIQIKEIAPGFLSKLIHTSGNTFNFIEVKAGNAVLLHSHMNEQSSFVLEGQFEMTIAGETQVLEPGSYCIIPSMVQHSGKAITDCKLLDIFNPAREDYKAL
jgi:quercetin dioxygenase-like cupin family protein